MVIELADYLEIKKREVEKKLDEILPQESNVDLASRHCTLAPAKRIRPILTLATTEILNGKVEDALLPACAVELIHSYSLIHDDLPCMDDDDFRRGIPSVHKAFNEAEAILAGDQLLTYAFEILTSSPNLSAEQKIRLIEELAKASGRQGMVGGQAMDIQSGNEGFNLHALETLHQKKTGALIETSIKFGAIIADASSQVMDALHTFGNSMGLAFQIQDDILDVTQSEAKHGRTVGSDLLNKKTTYVSLLGLDGAEEHAKKHTDLAIEALNGIPHNTDLLKNIAESLLSRET